MTIIAIVGSVIGLAFVFFIIEKIGGNTCQQKCCKKGP